MNNPFSNAISTLLTNGFNIHKVDRLPHNNNLVHAYKYDKLGAKVTYSILFTDDEEESAIISTLLTESKNNNSTPIVVADHIVFNQCVTYTKSKFFNFFGGITNMGLILIPDLELILDQLGHNKLPAGLKGEADNLHEIYVKECLQFIMESPTRRYGIDRSFESLPDGVVLCKEGFILLLDSKAYSNGFSFQADDLKRFKSYIEDFRLRYSFLFGNILSFLVISGHFNDSVPSIENRSKELYKICNCKLSCITSKELGEITKLLKEKSTIRRSISWTNIFSELIVNVKLINNEIQRIEKDNLN